MKKKEERKFNCSISELFFVSVVIMESFVAHKEEVLAQRPKWKDPFIENINKKISEAKKKYLGTDRLQDQKTFTAGVLKIQKSAHNDLTMFKAQIQDDFKSDNERYNFL